MTLEQLVEDIETRYLSELDPSYQPPQPPVNTPKAMDAGTALDELLSTLEGKVDRVGDELGGLGQDVSAIESLIIVKTE